MGRFGSGSCMFFWSDFFGHLVKLESEGWHQGSVKPVSIDDASSRPLGDG